MGCRRECGVRRPQPPGRTGRASRARGRPGPSRPQVLRGFGPDTRGRGRKRVEPCTRKATCQGRPPRPRGRPRGMRKGQSEGQGGAAEEVGAAVRSACCCEARPGPRQAPAKKRGGRPQAGRGKQMSARLGAALPEPERPPRPRRRERKAPGMPSEVDLLVALCS